MEINIELSNLLTNYFSRYANHIVYERAIPLLNDGLKPVQRRVLMSMNNLGLAPNKPMKKCAKIVGDTVGQYHPHSLDGPYGALVNMTATFSCRYPLSAGSGNFGSLQNDPPAAFRYTESKLSDIGALLLRYTEIETVPWIPTYDNSGVEPVSLGGLFPNILCNYTNGIAAGVSSMIPSHNATEVYTALIKTIDRITKGKDIDVDFLLKYIKGPDFPTGGIIINDSDISSAYKNGKGKFIIRGEYTIKNKKELVFHSIPYTTNLSVIVKSLKKLREQKLCGEFKDVSAKGNVELIIKPARGQSVDNLIENVFKKTKLEDNFNSIFTMIRIIIYIYI
jgi:DNA topoisomerase (ATP-hydrolyzing)